MNEHPDFKPGFNLILCYYAIRDAERMRKSFLKLLNVNSNVDDEKYNVIRYIRTIASTSLVNGFSENKNEQSLREIIQNDPLRQLERQRKSLAEKTIVNAAKIIAPCIEGISLHIILEMINNRRYICSWLRLVRWPSEAESVY